MKNGDIIKVSKKLKKEMANLANKDEKIYWQTLRLNYPELKNCRIEYNYIFGEITILEIK